MPDASNNVCPRGLWEDSTSFLHKFPGDICNNVITDLGNAKENISSFLSTVFLDDFVLEFRDYCFRFI